MPKIYSPEVRELAIAAYDRGLGTEAEVAAMFDIGEASLRRWRRQLREAGSVEPGKIGGFVPPLIPDDKLEVVRRLVAENNDAFLHQLAELYENETPSE